jgi:hypothetical protein
MRLRAASHELPGGVSAGEQVQVASTAAPDSKARSRLSREKWFMVGSSIKTGVIVSPIPLRWGESEAVPEAHGLHRSKLARHEGQLK